MFQTIGREGAECGVCETLPVWERKCQWIEAHHFILKSKGDRLRWDLRNRVMLGIPHHTGSRETSAHGNSNWFDIWMKENRYADWVYCHEAKKEIVNYKIHDLQDMIDNFLD